jgi:hypothetical protein
MKKLVKIFTKCDGGPTWIRFYVADWDYFINSPPPAHRNVSPNRGIYATREGLRLKETL